MILPDEWAKAGAAFLDEHIPSWWREIEAAKINAPAIHRSVLGQLFGHTDAGVDALQLDQRQKWELGFVTLAIRHWDPLTAAWKREILIRQEQEKAAEAHQHELF